MIKKLHKESENRAKDDCEKSRGKDKHIAHKNEEAFTYTDEEMLREQ